MSTRIRTILADDHALVLQGLQGMLEQHEDIEIVATAQDGQELLELLDEYEVDVIVLDIQMPFDGFSVLKEIRNRDVPVSVLLLTAFSDGETLQMALDLDAEGFALKTESPTQTVFAIRQVAAGQLVFPRAAQKLMRSRKEPEPTESLSGRENEVLALVAEGCTNPEIGAKLSVSENTIRFHLKNIFEKLSVTNRTEAAAWYLKRKMPAAYAQGALDG